MEEGTANLGAPDGAVPCAVCGRSPTVRPFYASDSLVCGSEEECYRIGYRREMARARAMYAVVDRMESVLRGLAVSAVNGDYDAEKMCTRLIEEADNAEHALDGDDQGNATEGRPQGIPPPSRGTP